MSVDARYFTNGEKAAYTLLHTDTGEVEEFQRKEDIPKSVRHLFRNMNRPKIIGPDLAMFLGLKSVFYPDWPKMCGNKGFEGKRCVGESCIFCTTPTDWKRCPFLMDREEKENGKT